MLSTTINFLPNRVYPTLASSGYEVGNSLGHNLSVKYGATNINSTARAIKGLGPCVGLTIFTPKHKFNAHSAPEFDTNSNSIIDFIAEKINEIRTKSNCKDDEVSAIIYGGIAYDQNNPLSEASCSIVDTLERSCEVEGVEPAIITGQYSDGLKTRIDSHIGSRQITLWGKWIDKMQSSINASQSEIRKRLEEIFEYVKIPQNYRLNVLDDVPSAAKHLVK